MMPSTGLTDDNVDECDLGELISAIPEGWSRVDIFGGSWGITRTTRAGGRAISFDAFRLGSAEQLGANVWLTSDGAVLRPCEVSPEEVLRLMRAAADASTV
ncbi:MAG TPA: peptide methionine sulfoxide reductase [Microbacterium sp.]|nr:peptide methionine sulfoxide reductase [Microbacterium sp.]